MKKSWKKTTLEHKRLLNFVVNKTCLVVEKSHLIAVWWGFHSQSPIIGDKNIIEKCCVINELL